MHSDVPFDIPQVLAAPAPLTETEFAVNAADLEANSRLRHGDRVGWSVRMRLRANYFTPDEYYEVLLSKLVTPETEWLDVGCGRNLLPGNVPLSRRLADRCRRLVGLDPDDTLQDNEFVHERIQCPIEDYHAEGAFDLVTLRMVAEHISDPGSSIRTLARLTRPGGRVVVYTVSKWAMTALAARLTPMSVHHALKSRLWQTEERDTFPVRYRMNTRRRLARLFGTAGFREMHFERLDDARLFWRFRRLHAAELAVWRFARRVRLPHPEACLLAVYEKRPAPDTLRGARIP